MSTLSFPMPILLSIKMALAQIIPQRPVAVKEVAKSESDKTAESDDDGDDDYHFYAI